jgi:hypothetical protein
MKSAQTNRIGRNIAMIALAIIAMASVALL